MGARATLPVPWPTSPSEVIPDGDAAAGAQGRRRRAPTPSRPTPPAAPHAAPRRPRRRLRPRRRPRPRHEPRSTTPSPPASAPPPATSPAAAAVETTHLGAIGDGLVFIDRDQRRGLGAAAVDGGAEHQADAAGCAFTPRRGSRTAATFAAQQAVVELAPAPAFGVRAGLLLLPLGIINQLNAPHDVPDRRSAAHRSADHPDDLARAGRRHLRRARRRPVATSWTSWAGSTAPASRRRRRSRAAAATAARVGIDGAAAGRAARALRRCRTVS